MLVLGAAMAASAAAEKLSLRQAMQRARDGAQEVSAARLRARAAEQKLRQASGFRLPAVSLEESFIRTDSPADAFALQLNQERFSFADFMSADPNDPATLDTAITRLQIALPIYTGGELSGRIAQAGLAASAAERSAAWIADNAALAAAEAYVAVAQAREYAALLERARDTVAAHVELARSYVAQGMLVRSELLRAEVELGRVEDLLAEARGNVRVASANLAFRLGGAQDTEWELEPVSVPPESALTLEELLASAEGRGDLAAARELLRAGELEEKAKRAAFLPKVALVGRADWVDDALFGTNGDSTSIMALASINLFAGGSDRAALRAARFEAEAGAKDVERFVAGVALEVRQAFEEARTERLRHATALRAVEAAAESERITKERFGSGVVKMIDLLDASTARREAETRELVARARACAAALRLAVRSGRAPETVWQ